MSDVTPGHPLIGSPDEASADIRRPRHRRDDVPVDGGEEPDLSEFGENPDTELAG